MAGEPRSRESKSRKLTLDEYQARCGDTANYTEAGTGSVTAITYCVLGLAGEAGEVADKWKKVLRGDHGDGIVPQEIKNQMVQEVGDTTWYAARLSIELGVALSKVAQGTWISWLHGRPVGSSRVRETSDRLTCAVRGSNTPNMTTSITWPMVGGKSVGPSPTRTTP